MQARDTQSRAGSSTSRRGRSGASSTATSATGPCAASPPGRTRLPYPWDAAGPLATTQDQATRADREPPLVRRGLRCHRQRRDPRRQLSPVRARHHSRPDRACELGERARREGEPRLAVLPAAARSGLAGRGRRSVGAVLERPAHRNQDGRLWHSADVSRLQRKRGMLDEPRHEPVGILFHTSESDIWPLEAEYNEDLRDSSHRLLRYIRRKVPLQLCDRPVRPGVPHR